MRKYIAVTIAALALMTLLFTQVGAGSIGFSKVTISTTTSTGTLVLSTNFTNKPQTLISSSTSSLQTVHDLLSDSGILTGLGNASTYATFLSGTGYGVYLCQSPGGGTQPPGHNPTNYLNSVSPADLIANSSIHNGKSPFGNTSTDPSTWYTQLPTWQDLGCPNPNWVAFPYYFNWTHARITVTSDGNPPASDGSNVLAWQDYSCNMPNPSSISCTLLPPQPW